MTRDEVWRRLKVWVYKQEHYYVGYALKGQTKEDMSDSFESLVDEVCKMIQEGKEL